MCCCFLQVKTIKAEKVVAPISGAEGVGLSLQDYTKSRGIDSVVMGSRGMGSFSNALLTTVGLGSVSRYCAGSLPCSVMIHKDRPVRHGKQGSNKNGGDYKF